MKTLTIQRKDFPFAPYPNASTRREIMHNIIDRLLILASCAGLASVILLLVAMA